MHRRAIPVLVAPLLALLVGGAALAANAVPRAASSRHLVSPRMGGAYAETDLVSDVPGAAANLDPNLVNAWGLAAGPSSPWWVADNATDVSTLYTGDGTPLSLVVKVAGSPTGEVFNGGSGFVVSHEDSSGPAVFIFATEDGTIRGWSPGVPPPASTKTVLAVDRSNVDAIYKGLAIAATATGDRLYAADFHNARIDVFDSQFNLLTPAQGTFVDPGLPPRFAPFGIRNIGGVLFIAYAKQDRAAEDEVAGAGLGFVDTFDLNGNLLGRVATRSHLNAPWGLALGPPSFGRFGGDLLVGNFGNGQINAYVQHADGTFTHDGTLRMANGNVLAIDGLWAIDFGNGGPAGPTDTLFFTAGPDDESHGLFGSIEATG